MHVQDPCDSNIMGGALITQYITIFLRLIIIIFIIIIIIKRDRQCKAERE